MNVIVDPESGKNAPEKIALEKIAPRIMPIKPTEPVMPIKPIRPEQELTTQQEEIMTYFSQPTFQYLEVSQSMNTNYNNKESNHSMICDIIAMYLKGQKILYIEAKTLCEHRLNFLMLPTICITAVCSVISIALKEYQYGALIVSSLNALNFFFLNLINYLKLDAKAEAHRVAAYKFDKIQSKLEFNSGKILFIAGASKNLEKLINDTENDVRDIKETNQFILPEEIRHNYPLLNNINVFSEVKKLQSDEIKIVNRLKDVMNKMVEKHVAYKVTPTDALKQELEELHKKRESITHEYITIKNEYLMIDDQFEIEMREQREKLSTRWQLCSFLKS
jgi:hypothetical protein